MIHGRISGRRLRLSALVLTTAALLLASAACGSSTTVASGASTTPPSLSAYDALVTGGPVASAADVDANAWAKKVKQQGYLKVGGTDANQIFSLRDLASGELRGFDAGLEQMLAHYITGKTDVKSLTQLTSVTADTRETLLQNNSVDVVVATYSITPARAQKVAFAGPYFVSGDAILVRKGDSSIKSVNDLTGKTVATESNSTATVALKKYAPGANVQLFQTNAECVAAVQQGRADAYVLDQGILLGDALTNPEVKVVPGAPFTTDPYGIGLNKDGDGKAFVNTFLTTIVADGTWAKLWQATIGKVIGGDAPTPPTIGSVAGS